jgi:hypothetical protein
MSTKAKCDGHNGYKCIQGKLFEEKLISGTMEPRGDCPICLGTVVPEAKKVVQMPGVPEREKVVAAEPGTRQVFTNIMGHQRMPTNPKQEEFVRRVRDLGLELYVLLHDAGGTDPNQERFANRNLAIASTELENVIMHAVKGICTRK